jgi:hypothetical protein
MSTLKMRGGKLSMNAGKLTCVCCCPNDLSLEWRSRSASKTKCGNFDPEQPNERFLSEISCVVGALRTRVYDPEDCTFEDTLGCDAGCGFSGVGWATNAVSA